MEQLLNDLQNVLDQLKAAAVPVEPAIDPLRSAVEAELLAEGWAKPSQPVSVPVVAVESAVAESETPAEDASPEDVNEVNGN